MNPNIMECDNHKLKLLLAADERTVEHDPWMQHVEHCSHCQLRLRELAAQADDWQKAAEVLADDDVPYFGRDHDAPSSWNESMVKQLLEPPSHPEMLGRLGRYEMERMIGCGGMGIVFKAFDTELNRVVAVKLLEPYLAARGSARKRFAREARAAAGVRDDHVVPIFNVESEHEPPFLVMQYVAGGSLQEKLDRDGPLEVAEVLRIGLQTAKGLAAAHAQGLIHRDVKPSNILLDEGVERALLTDFGLARAEDDACLTRSGFHPGTPHYMSPEQVRGEAIDGRSDLFSLGCVLYALCTGHSPFRAETSYAVMRRITDESPRLIREQNANIPEWLEAIVMKLLSKSREDRFASAKEVAELLEDCLAHVHQPTTVPLPASLVPRAVGIPRSTFFATRKGVMTMLGTIGMAFLGMLLWQSTEAPDISGQWTSEEWGTVVLKAIEPGQYEGTFNGSEKVEPVNDAENNISNKVSEGASGTSTPQSAVKAIPPGKLHVKWSAIEGRFNGNWGTGDDTKGKISLRLVDNEIRGACTSTSESRQESTSPQLTDLLWKRSGVTSTAFVAAAEQEYEQLELAEEVLQDAYVKAIDSAQEDWKRKQAAEQLDPRDVYTPKYLAFEEKYRGTPAGLKALIKVVGFARSTFSGPAPAGRVEVIDRLIDQYVAFDGIEQLFDDLRSGLPVPREKELLKAVVELNPSRHVRAEAMIAQFKLNRKLLGLHESLSFPPPPEWYSESQRSIHMAFQRVVENVKPDELRDEQQFIIEQLRRHVGLAVSVYGRAESAAEHLSNMNRIVYGNRSPEIAAITSTGKSFRLSGMRGRTVVLVFAQDEEADNDLMYAPLRKLATDYKSKNVEVVMILTSDDRNQRSAAALKHDFPWTVIQQPHLGRLLLDWNVQGFPEVHLIDAKGILRSSPFMPQSDVQSGYDTTMVAAELDKILALKQSNNNACIRLNDVNVNCRAAAYLNQIVCLGCGSGVSLKESHLAATR